MQMYPVLRCAYFKISIVFALAPATSIRQAIKALSAHYTTNVTVNGP